MPRLSRSPSTGEPIDKKTIRGIFKTRCYDGEARPEDTWVYQHSLAQDMVPEALKPLRMACAKHILHNTHANSWCSHIAIGPCYIICSRKHWTARKS